MSGSGFLNLELDPRDEDLVDAFARAACDAAPDMTVVGEWTWGALSEAGKAAWRESARRQIAALHAHFEARETDHGQ